MIMKNTDYKYDIFISYRNSCGIPIGIYHLGSAIGRCLANAFSQEGFKVFFDCECGEGGTIEGSDLTMYMAQSRLILVVLCNCFLTDPISDGFKIELKQALEDYKQDSQRVLYVSFNASYKKEVKHELLPQEFTYEKFFSDRYFQSSMTDLLKRVKRMGVKPTGITSQDIQSQLKKRIRWLLLAIGLLCLTELGFLYYSRLPRLSFAGGGTVKNFLEKEKHFDFGNLPYWPTPSGLAPMVLVKYAQQLQTVGGLFGSFKGRYLPVVLSLGPISEDIEKFTNSSNQAKTWYCQGFLLGKANAVVSLYPADSSYQGTITPEQLIDLLQNNTAMLYTTDVSSSGTYAMFSDVIGKGTLDSLRRNFDTCWEDFSGLKITNAESLLKKGRKKAIILENQYYTYCTDADSKLTRLTLVGNDTYDTVSKPLYAYTVMTDNQCVYFWSPLAKFLKKAGTPPFFYKRFTNKNDGSGKIYIDSTIYNSATGL